jgi:hypothetical protein
MRIEMNKNLGSLQFRASPTTKAVNRGERKKAFFLEWYSTHKSKMPLIGLCQLNHRKAPYHNKA